jgi:hypothetical protein
MGIEVSSAIDNSIRVRPSVVGLEQDPASAVIFNVLTRRVAIRLMADAIPEAAAQLWRWAAGRSFNAANPFFF